MNDDRLLHRWIEGNLTPEELKEFRTREEYPDLERIYRNTEHLRGPAFDTESVLQRILSTPKPAGGTVRTLNVRRILSYAAAACVLLAAAWFLWPASPTVTQIATGAGEQINEILPDGSAVLLNAESSLSYLPDTWSKERRLELSGEAYFEVEEGSTFTVQTALGAVQVLGTEFNVRLRDMYLEVTCQGGKVRVSDLQGTRLRDLSPGQGIRVSQDGKAPEELEVPANRQPDWLRGLYRFREVPLSVPIAELERQFGVELILQGVDTDRIISCNFQTEDLSLALASVFGPLNYQFEIQPNDQVIISK
ncbi:MAG: FecR domain-containing protein [Bacteroidota bacterium]